jgi:hypothetical protein
VLVVGAVALTAGSACGIKTEPELSGDARRSTALPVIPVRTTADTPDAMQFGDRPAPVQPDVPMTSGGLMCGGVYCPYAPVPGQPCCTTADDVTRGAARVAGVCGIDLGATTDASWNTACWQRDQLGVPGDGCEPQTVGGIAEQGCCTDQGLCGSANTSFGIGCHYSIDAAPEGCGDVDIVDAVECEAGGVFGVKAVVDVSWGGRSGGLVGLTDDGRAPIEIFLRVEATAIKANNELEGTIRPCGVVLPPFYSTTLCESYNPIFPPEMWDSATMPSFPLLGSYQCLNPGCSVTLAAQTTLLGIALQNPEAPWPTPQQTPELLCPEGKGVACFPDHDSNMLPGLSIELVTSGVAPPGVGCMGMYRYNGAPLSADIGAIFGGVRRSDHILLGVRTKLGGTGRLANDCNSAVGAGIAEFVQSRAYGCVVQPGTADFGGQPALENEPCTAAQAAFMDENLPIYRVLAAGEAPDDVLNVVDESASLGPLFSMVRLGRAGDAVTCQAVRDAAYP